MRQELRELMDASRDNTEYLRLFQEFCHLISTRIAGNELFPGITFIEPNEENVAVLRALNCDFNISYKMCSQKDSRTNIAVLVASVIDVDDDNKEICHYFFDDLGNNKENIDDPNWAMHSLTDLKFLTKFLETLTRSYLEWVNQQYSK